MGKALFMVGGFQKGWRGDEMEFKVKELRLLEGIAENMTESITIKLHLETITPETIDQLDTLCKRHRGKHRLRMEVIDIPRRLKLKLMAKERKVQADNEFIAELDKMGVEYAVN